jgi:hypothetical protein
MNALGEKTFEMGPAKELVKELAKRAVIQMLESVSALVERPVSEPKPCRE